VKDIWRHIGQSRHNCSSMRRMLEGFASQRYSFELTILPFHIYKSVWWVPSPPPLHAILTFSCRQRKHWPISPKYHWQLLRQYIDAAFSGIWWRAYTYRLKVVHNFFFCKIVKLDAFKSGGGNIRPAGHIRPAKASFLDFKRLILHEYGPRDTNKSPIWPADENSSPPLI